MRPRTSKRMTRVRDAIDTLPVRPWALQKAFQNFRETGDLPEEQRLADAVARKVLGLEGVQDPGFGVVVAGSERRPTVRECLLDEAVHGDDYIRRVARAALQWEVDGGADPTDPQFLADRDFPTYGSVGLSLLGYPERLVVPPYENQAHRLFARLGSLLEQVDRADPEWLEDTTMAILRLQTDGRLPAEAFLRDLVLAYVEMDALIRHQKGEDVGDLVAAFDRAASLTGSARGVAAQQVAVLVSGKDPEDA